MISNVITNETITNWPLKLLQKDPSGQSAGKVYRLLSQTEAGKKEHELLLQLEKMITETSSVKPKVKQSIFTPIQRQTRADTTLCKLLLKRLEKPATELMPAEIWGRVGLFLLNTEGESIENMTKACKTFRSSPFWNEILLAAGLTTLDVRKAIGEKKPLIPESFLDGKFDFLIPFIFDQVHLLDLHTYHELPVGAEYLEEIAKIFPKVTCISLASTTLTEAHFEKLATFKELKILYLDDCKLEPVHLAKLPNSLTSLSLVDCDLQDGDIDRLAHLLHLSVLDLSNNTFTAKLFRALKAFQKLSELKIRSCPNIVPEQVTYMPQSITTVECGDDKVKEALLRALPKGKVSVNSSECTLS